MPVLIIYATVNLFITDHKLHTKTKIRTHACLYVSKIGLQNPKIVLRPYFRFPRARKGLIFVKVCVKKTENLALLRNFDVMDRKLMPDSESVTQN